MNVTWHGIVWGIFTLIHTADNDLWKVYRNRSACEFLSKDVGCLDYFYFIVFSLQVNLACLIKSKQATLFWLSTSLILFEDHETIAAGDKVSHLDWFNESETSESLSGGHRAAWCRCRSCQNLPHDRCLLRLSSAYKCAECLLPSGLPSLRLWLKLWAPCADWTAGVNWPWWKYDRKCSMWSDVPLFSQVSIWALSATIDAISQSGGSWGDE